MSLPRKEKGTGKYYLPTRWTAAQYLEIKRRAKARGLSIQEYIERKIFDLELNPHPAPREQ